MAHVAVQANPITLTLNLTSGSSPVWHTGGCVWSASPGFERSAAYVAMQEGLTLTLTSAAYVAVQEGEPLEHEVTAARLG